MITPDDLLSIPLFAALPRALLVRIAGRAADIRVNAGESIVYDGDPPNFWALLEGEVEGVKLIAGEYRQTTTFDPGEYFGEVPLMLSTAAFLGVRALKPSRLARIEPTEFHVMITESADAAAILAQTLLRRVNYLRDMTTAATLTQATIVGDRYDFACHDMRDFFSRNNLTFEWLDPSNPADVPCMPAQARESGRFPLVVLTDGRVLESPTLRELARSLNLQTQPAQEHYDVAIIGGGPAGLAAAVYGGSEGLKTIMIEREAPGGQAGTSSRIENYLGFPGGVSGGDLAKRALLQAKRFGTEILVTRSVESIVATAGGHAVGLDGGDVVRSRAIVLATGVAWRKLAAAGADRLIGRGVYYGAARTEALGTRGKDIFLIGGGNSAGQAAMFFANYARSVTLLVRGVSLASSMSHYLIEQLATKSNIHVETRTVVEAVNGKEHLETILTRDVGTDIASERQADALFTFIGADAETDWLPPAIERDARGYILTGHQIRDWHESRMAFSLETSVPGIFAAGDVRSASVKRVASGVGEGSMVIAYIHEYLASLAVPA